MRRIFFSTFFAMTILSSFVLQTSAQIWTPPPSVVMCNYKDSVFVALSEGQNSKVYNFVRENARIDASTAIYNAQINATGKSFRDYSPVTAMIQYREGVLTAFTKVIIDRRYSSRIYWSPSGRNLGDENNGSPIVYEGDSPVTAMLPYKNGVLVALTNVGNKSNWNQIDFYDNWDITKPGKLQTGGRKVDDGESQVTAMISYKNGILVAMNNVLNSPRRYRVHWCDNFDPNGSKTIGQCETVYDGMSPVTAMLPYNNGVPTAFTNNRDEGLGANVVYFSPDGKNLGNQPNNIKYIGTQPVIAFSLRPVSGTRPESIITAFPNWIQLTIKGESLNAGENVYGYPR
jgi:hypothetical protein